MGAAFPLFYAGNVEYYTQLLSHSNITFDLGEYFVKQTYRNRCVISTANGLQTLVIPTIREHQKTSMSQVKISYAEKWQQIHWRAITSAYKKSPYFEYYEHLFIPFYENKTVLLSDFNKGLMGAILKVLKTQKEFNFTESYIEQPDEDFRTVFQKNNSSFQHPTYIQVFSDRFDFEYNLSIFDLLFNCGPNSIKYLIKK